MSTALEQLLYQHKYPVITDTEISNQLHLYGDSKYGRIKRAIKAERLVPLRRGLYLIQTENRLAKPNPLAISAWVYWPSYVSLQSALAYHGLIPEAVVSTTCVTSKRYNEFTTPLGVFSYHKVPAANFFFAVERVETKKSVFLVASPWKAILDYLYCYKKNWLHLADLEADLRIDPNELPTLHKETATKLVQYYKSKRVMLFLQTCC